VDEKQYLLELLARNVQ